MIQLPVFPAFEKNNLAISLQSSDYFAPYASVTILSIIENSSPEYNYDIIVMAWDMQEENEAKLISIADGRDNVSVRVLDIRNGVKKYDAVKKQDNNKRFGISCIIRLAMADLLEHYDIALNVDCDMLFKADISEVFKNDVESYYMAAAKDTVAYVLYYYPYFKYYNPNLIQNILKLDSIKDYYNGGFLLLNLKKIRNDFSVEQMYDFSLNNEIEILDQDTINAFFFGKVLELSVKWNWMNDARSIIKRYSAFLSRNDHMILEYYAAEKTACNLHYATSIKPWDNAASPYAGEWWDVAFRSPCLNTILSRASDPNSNAANANANKDSFDNNQYILFFCESAYQLINVLNIKYHYYRDVPADIVLTSTSNVLQYFDSIKKLNLFKRIICTDYEANSGYLDIYKMSISLRTLHPEKYEFALPLSERYSDYFMPVPASLFQKMTYYQLVNQGRIPKVHIYEDGMRNYYESISQLIAMDIDHSLYPEHKRLMNNIVNLFLNLPELYCVGEKIKTVPLHSISSEDQDFINILTGIFGKCTMPKEKYIFFSECWARELKPSNDTDILEKISEQVGKENIIVKIHPRAENARELFELRGYKIFPDDSIPWEMYALSPEINNKVLMAVSSNTPFSPFIISGSKNIAISLTKLMKLSKRPHARLPLYQRFINRTVAFGNKNSKIFFCPNTMEELRMIIEYIEGEVE